MGFTGRLAVMLGLVLTLSSCLLTPGKFAATLDIRRDRSFTFTYVGEVIAMPSSPGTGANDSDGDGGTRGMGEPPAPDDAQPIMMQIAAKGRQAPSGKGAPPKASAPPTPDASGDTQRMQALAEALSREYGYRSVKYLGNYRFQIDYAISGKLDHSFLFPFNLDGEVIVPFLAIELRGRDHVRVKAPGFARNDSMAAGMPDIPGLGQAGGDVAKNPAANAMDGSFTLTTDAGIVSQNQENGATTLANGRKQIVWRATPQTKDAPTAALQVDALP